MTPRGKTLSSLNASKSHAMTWIDIKKRTFGLRWWRKICSDSAGLWVVQYLIRSSLITLSHVQTTSSALVRNKYKAQEKKSPQQWATRQKTCSRDGLVEREVASTTNPIYRHWSLFSSTNQHSVSGLSTNRKERAKMSFQQSAAREGKKRHQGTNLLNSLITLSHTQTGWSGF